MSNRAEWQRYGILRNIAGHVRMLLCLLAGLAAYPVFARWQIPAPALVAWNFGVVLYILVSARMMGLATEETIRRRAAMIDESRFIVLAISMTAIAASFAAIFGELRGLEKLEGGDRLLHAGMAAITILTNWTLIHLVFTQHYAHEFFMERASEAHLPSEDRGGLRFPATHAPDYSDFLYFSFVIGVAAQTADVAITTKPMRKLNTVHCVLSFFFNATVLALTINIVAGILAS